MDQAQRDETAKQLELLSALSAEKVPDDGPKPGDDLSDDGEEDMGVTLVKKGKGKGQHTVENLNGSLYSHPRIYDWAFGYRDYEEEVHNTRMPLQQSTLHCLVV